MNDHRRTKAAPAATVTQMTQRLGRIEAQLTRLEVRLTRVERRVLYGGGALGLLMAYTRGCSAAHGRRRRRAGLCAKEGTP